MRHLDLFSGIGGFALGLKSVGFETIGFCEIDPFCRKVLKKHWPEVQNYGDIGDYGWISVPGFIDSWEEARFRGGEEFPDFTFDWLVIENEGHRWRQWVPLLRRTLFRRGYASLPLRVRADHLGFPHRRARVFIVANPDSEQLRQLSRWWGGEGRQVASELANPENYAPRRLGADDGLPNWAHRRRALGNAVVPQIVALIGQGIIEVSAQTPEPPSSADTSS